MAHCRASLFNIDVIKRLKRLPMGDTNIRSLHLYAFLYVYVFINYLPSDRGLNVEHVLSVDYLFTDDPNEYYNLAFREPHKVMELKKKLDIYKKSMVPANVPKNDPNSKPEYFDGYWSPGWC